MFWSGKGHFYMQHRGMVTLYWRHTPHQYEGCWEGCTLCPWNVLMGLSEPSRYTWMSVSAEHEAKHVLLCQSTSSVGDLWWEKHCLTSPVDTSHTTAVWMVEDTNMDSINVKCICVHVQCILRGYFTHSIGSVHHVMRLFWPMAKSTMYECVRLSDLTS